MAIADVVIRELKLDGCTYKSAAARAQILLQQELMPEIGEDIF